MTPHALAGRTLLTGVALALIAAGPAQTKFCWKSNGKTICVTGGSKPRDCTLKPCVITYPPGQGGNNKPTVVLERPAVAVAPVDDISRGLNLKTFDANRYLAAPKAMDKMRAPGGQ